MNSLLLRRERIDEAVIYLGVFFVGIIFLAVLAVNLYLFSPYIRSVPLHSIKTSLLAHVNTTVGNEDVSLVRVFWLGVKFPLKKLMGVIWVRLFQAVRMYLAVIRSISAVSSTTPAASQESTTLDASSAVATATATELHDQPLRKRRGFPQSLEQTDEPSQLDHSSADLQRSADEEAATFIRKRRSSHLRSKSLDETIDTRQTTAAPSTPQKSSPEPVATSPLHLRRKGSAALASGIITTVPLAHLSTAAAQAAPEVSVASVIDPTFQTITNYVTVRSTTDMLSPTAYAIPGDFGAMSSRPGTPPSHPDDVSTHSHSTEADHWTSGVYMLALFRCSAAYLAYSVCRSWGADAVYAYIGLGSTLGVAMSTHVLYHLAKRAYRVLLVKQRLQAVAGSRKLHGTKRIMKKTARVVSTVWSASFKHSARAIRTGYKKGKTGAKQAFMRNANSFAALFVLISVLTISVLLSGFLLVKIGQEANQLMEGTLSVMDSVMSDDVRDRLQSVVQDGYSMGVEWADKRLSKAYPHANVTVASVHAKLMQTYRTIRRQPSPTLTSDSQSAVLMAPPAFSSGMVPSAVSAGQHVGQAASHSHVSRLLAIVAAGNLTMLTDSSLLASAFAELKSASSLFVASLVKGDGALGGTSASSLLSSSSTYLSGALQTLVSVGLSMALSVAQLCIYFFGVLFQFAVFLFTLYFLLEKETCVTEWFAQLLASVDPDQRLTTALEGNIQAVLECTFKLTLFHSVFTWLTFSMFGVELVYMSTFVTALVCIIPVVSPMWLSVPASMSLWWQGRPVAALTLTILHAIASWTADTAFLAEIPEVNPYFSAFSFILGFRALGLEGLVAGPVVTAVLPPLVRMVANSRW
ncbi:hypothetical protein RI367_001496 [Sorochytrium milnesiophthora]